MANISTNFNAIAKEMTDVGKKETMEKLAEDLRPSAERVKMAAQNLINYAMSLQNKYGLSVADQLATLDTESEAAVLNFSKKYVKEKADYSKLMEYVFDFQNIVNEFLGQKIIMTFVAISPTSGKVTLYNMENSVKDLSLDQAATSRGGHITGRMSSLQKIKNASKEMINSSYNDNEKATLDRTFQEVWQRYRISKNKVQLGGAAYIIWYLSTSPDGVWISGAGPLGEAYVAFFINNYVFSNQIEPSVKDFMLNDQYGSVRADNASGFLKGDIVKDAANFGVKVRGAQPISYMEVIKYAQEILQSTDVTQYLTDLAERLEKDAVQNMVKPLSAFTQEQYQSVVDEVKNRIDQIGTTFSSHGGVLVAKLNRRN